jgi:peptide/nickel transport system permease protein
MCLPRRRGPILSEGTKDSDMPIYLYILKRILIAIPTLILVSMISFFIMRYDITIGPIQLKLSEGHTVQVLKEYHFKNPIDPLAELKNNPQISRAALAREKERLGLDQPLYVQYGRWIGHMFHMDFSQLKTGRFWTVFQPDLGKSFSGEDVSTILRQRIPNTLMLNLITVFACWLIAIPLGIYAALRWRTTADSLLTLLSSIGMSAPSFVIALLLAVIAVKIGWPPVGGITSEGFQSMPWYAQVGDIASHLILPVIILTISGIAGLQRQMRGNLLEVLEAEYVRVARAKGLPENKVIYKHAVRTAINPLITLLGYEFAGLLSGAALVEMVLRFPGLGYTALEAVRQTDTNLAMAILLIGATLLVLGNLLADILLKIVDPRIELQ